ncbi:TIR domain-containing protein [Umezawaea sp.]|uniref:TIR domain-containing protein n=1 Tax=Umezawaea sp. TaxID=1955258 RepID=UPI002ED37F5E
MTRTGARATKAAQADVIEGAGAIIFLSYTRADEPLVRALREDFERLGWQVWMDREIHGGEQWWREIIRAIQEADVFVFALSQDSWSSQPCREELDYAQKLGVPVLPVQVGSVQSVRIPIMETQGVDYRERSANAALALVAALTELTSRPVVRTEPPPEPPRVPFEYLYRIAEILGPTPIPPDRQEDVIVQLRRKLREERDAVARADIVKLLREFRRRRELTVGNSEEIDQLLEGAEAAGGAAQEDGATRLPPTDHWRQSLAAEAERARKAAEKPDRTASPRPTPRKPPRSQPPPAPKVGKREPAHDWHRPATPPTQAPPTQAPPNPAPRTQGTPSPAPGSPTPVPPNPAPSTQTPPTPEPSTPAPPTPEPPTPAHHTPAPPTPEPPTPAHRTPAPPTPAHHTAESPTPAPAAESDSSSTPPAWLGAIIDRGTGESTPTTPPPPSSPTTSGWWKAAETPPVRTPAEEPTTEASTTEGSTAEAPPNDGRLAFAGGVLGAMGVPLGFAALLGRDRTGTQVGLTVLLIASVLGLSVALVSLSRGEQRSQVAVAVSAVGLLGVVLFVLTTGHF